MIEDRELRDLFRAECEEHLARLDQGLLRLEANPAERGVLDELFREAHSLKGAARMLAVSGVEKIAHRLEDALNAARRGESALTLEGADRLYRALDALRRLVHEAVTGEPSGVEVAEVLARLDPGAPSGKPNGPTAAPGETAVTRAPSPLSRDDTAAVPPPAPPAAQDPPPNEEAEAVPPVFALEGRAAAAGASPAVALSAPYRVETIRVEPQRLDELMRLAGELAVARLRVTRRLADIDRLVALLEEWEREELSHRFALDLQRRPSPGTRPGAHLTHAHERVSRLAALADSLRAAAQEDHTRLESVAGKLGESIRAVRLIPLGTLFTLFQRMVRDLAREQSKEVEFVIEGSEIAADKRILEEMKDPLMHLLRNAIDHGIEPPEERARRGKRRMGTVCLRAIQTAEGIAIEVTDDGRGLDPDAIARAALRRRVCGEEELAAMSAAQLQALIFAPGFSTRELITDVSGRGVGLDVVRANVERLKGRLEIESGEGTGCCLRVRLPVSLASARSLIASVHGRSYAIPVESVLATCLVPAEARFSVEGRQAFLFNGETVPLAPLADLLELPAPETNGRREAGTGEPLPCVMLMSGEERLGLLVDSLLDEQEVMVNPLGCLLPRVRNVAGTALLGTGQVCVVLNPGDLLKSARRRRAVAAPAPVEETPRKWVILLADDSITTRTQEKRILEGAGYEVVTAVDGLDALGKLHAHAVDGVVSDIEMPRMDGLALTVRIRQDQRRRELPIVLVTALASEEDMKRGLEAGADAYITKPAFDQRILIETLRRLL